ncbi:MAG: M23 family peptidase, partial [Epsilonproteobacteria bacterium]|nr:M23 family peptidase [Campylobacterota bacterium]
MRRKRSFGGILALIVFLLLIGGGIFIFTSKQFERNKPIISAKEKIYWDIKHPLKIVLKDDSGIKFAQAVLSDGKNSIVIANKIYQNPKKEEILEIKSPKNSFIYKQDKFLLTVRTIDSSKWNFFAGNEAIKNINIMIDSKKPELSIVNSSYGIRKGGSALVIFKA